MAAILPSFIYASAENVADYDELESETITVFATVTRAETFYKRNYGTINRLYFVLEDGTGWYIDVNASTYAKTKNGDAIEVWCYKSEYESLYKTWKMIFEPRTDLYVEGI